MSETFAIYMTWFSGEHTKLKQYTEDQHGFLLRKQESS